MVADPAVDYTAAHDAIRAVLTGESSGLPRSIAPGRFRWGPHRVRAGFMPPSAGDPPTTQVVFGAPRPHEGGPLSEQGNLRREVLPVTVEVLYALGGGDMLAAPDGGDLASVSLRAANDALAILCALGYPGALAAAPTGADTGLVSHCLMRGESDEPEIDEESKTLVARHRFEAWVELDQDV